MLSEGETKSWTKESIGTMRKYLQRLSGIFSFKGLIQKWSFSKNHKSTNNEEFWFNKALAFLELHGVKVFQRF